MVLLLNIHLLPFGRIPRIYGHLRVWAYRIICAVRTPPPTYNAKVIPWYNTIGYIQWGTTIIINNRVIGTVKICTQNPPP